MIFYPALGSLGRLGNQLFQIASTMGIAKANGTTCAFPQWKYEEYFETALPHAQMVPGNKTEEKYYHFDESLFKLDANKNYNLTGYLQSEKYWKHAEEDIRQQFVFKDACKEKLRSAFAIAFEKPLVAISIRRGDFVKNKCYYQVPIRYYLSAYYTHFPNCNILIFTDDFKYCKLHFEALDNVFYAEGLTDIEQLCLMSMCENFIISNSTFSWWGAYLSGSKNVIRPIKNMDGELGKLNNEKDYWLPEWKIHNDKIDLSDTTFVIPVFFDHEHRKLNVMLTVGFLLKNFHTNIIIGEQGGSKFCFMHSFCDYVQFGKMHVFHRTKMINDMVKMADMGIVVNWDCDNICSPAQLAEAVRLIRNGADMAYPFDGRVARVPRYMFNDVIESLDVHDINIQKCMPKCFTSVGHAVVMNKQSFIDAGMENENFVSWGPEDSERYDRFNMLGLNVQRAKGKMYHMDHYCGENSSTKHPFFTKNNQEFYKIKAMNKPELENYVNSFHWKPLNQVYAQ